MAAACMPDPRLSRRVRWIAVTVLALMLSNPMLLSAQDRTVVGWVEEIVICPGHMVLHAKLDTGARCSSLNAQNMTLFKRQGVSWVRFEVVDRSGRTETFEKPVIRTVRIKDHIRPADRRPVIRLGICLGNYYKEAEVNLTDRSEFKYQILVGRSFMAGHFSVDPSIKYSRPPSCAGTCEKPSY